LTILRGQRGRRVFAIAAACVNFCASRIGTSSAAEYKAIETVFGNPELFEAMLDRKEFPPGSDDAAARSGASRDAAGGGCDRAQRSGFGMKRTDYRNIAADLAAKLKMNYAFGVQVVELTPVHLSLEKEGATEQKRINGNHPR
jgi:hypothetical protein